MNEPSNPYHSTMSEPAEPKLSAVRSPRLFPVVTCVMLAAMFAASLSFRPFALRFFEEFDVNLPVFTLYTLHPATPYVHFALLLMAVCLLLFAKSPWFIRAGSWLLFLLGLGMFVVEALAIIMPYLAILRSLS